MIDAISDEDLRALAAIDALAVTDHLRERFGQDQIYLAGQSWGTTLRVLAVREPEKIIYNDTIDWARTTGRDGLVDIVLPATIADR